MTGEDSKQETIFILLLQLLLTGCGMSTAVFLAEVATKMCRRILRYEFFVQRAHELFNCVNFRALRRSVI